jgi:hypothetical protein
METTLISKREIKKKTFDDANNSKSTKKRKRGVYTNWFTPHKEEINDIDLEDSTLEII